MPPINFLQRQWVAKSAVITKARQVRKRTGKSVASQLQEITRLRFATGKLSPSDYFAYGVYDDQLYTRQGKRQVLSWNSEWLANAVNDRTWKALCDDKLLFYSYLHGLGMSFPEIYVAYESRPRSCGPIAVLTSADDMASFLRESISYPFFAKPLRDSYGRRVSFVDSIDRARDVLTFRTGEEIGVDTYVNDYVVAPKRGYLFQRPIVQHPLVHQLTGGRAATLRMIVLNGDDGPRLFRVIWRMPVGRNITDNFIGGMQGNLIAHVDRATGRVGKIIQAISFDGDADGKQGYRAIDIECHPDTGERIVGFTVPGWDELVSTCLTAATAFPGIRFQSWDVVIGRDGAQLLELNYNGGIRVIQVPGFGGLYDAEFQEFWSRYARPA